MTAERSPPRVLVVEDDADLAELYAEWLGGTYAVETAYDGTTALDRLDGTVDVVLLDRMMPGLSGEEVLGVVRDAEVDPQVVMVSAVTPDLDVVQMGFDAYLEKPIEAEELYETVERMLSRAEYDEKLRELFSLIERQETLEAVRRPEVLEASEEYRALVDRLESVQSDVESLLTRLPDDDFQVAVERLRRTAAERTDERRYESLTEDVLDSSRDAAVVVDDDGTVVWANAATERLLGLDRSDVRGRSYGTVAAEQFEPLEAGDASLVSLIRDGLAGHGRELEATVHVPAADGRPERWLEYHSAPIETGLYAGGRIEHYHEVTGRHQRERYLRSIHRATRELMAAETREAVVDLTVKAATVELDFPYAAVFTRDEATGDLVPAAQEATGAAVEPTLPTLSGGSGPVWTAFADRPELLDAATYREKHGRVGWLDEPFGEWAVCPLGQQGVLLVATTDGAGLSTTSRSLAKTWAANARQALEQIARSRRLRDREQKLQRRNERLTRLDRVNRLIRSTAPAVVSADSREEVETEVCRRLLRIDAVTGAWIAARDVPTGRTVSRASAGSLDEYLSGLPADPPSAPAAAAVVPARRAHETGSPVAVTDLANTAPGPWWRDRGLRRGTHTVVAVPVVHESTGFGALEIHIDRPRGMDDDEIEAFEQLGVTVGHAIGAIRRRDALLSGGVVALEFHVEADSGLSRLAAAVDVPLSVVDVSHRADGTAAAFVELEPDGPDDTDRVAETVRDHAHASVLRTDEASVTCAVTLGSGSAVRTMVERGAALRGVSLREGSTRLAVTVELSHSVDVREYVDGVTAALETAELSAKRDLSSAGRTDPGAAGRVDDRLTDRQREALQTAFHSGYFDWPRSTDAESVAAEIGIAQSTLSQHLRTAERKVLEGLFS